MSATKKEIAEKLYSKVLDKIKEIDDAMKTKDARIKRLEDALRFYADLRGWDQGSQTGEAVYKRARQALGGE